MIYKDISLLPNRFWSSACDGLVILSCRWLVNGSDVALGLDLRYTLVAGSLVISSPESVRDTGSYQCLAINRCGTIISRAANLKFGCERAQMSFGYNELCIIASTSVFK